MRGLESLHGAAQECVRADTSTQGYHCECDYCVPVDGSLDQCVTDQDCKEFAPTSTATCNPAAAGGICIGCQVPSDCPGNSQCTSYGTCALLCDDGSDCPYGVCHASGYCVQNKCISNAECYPGTICNNEDNDPTGGMCQRPTCKSKSPADCPTNYTCGVSGRCERLPCP